MQVLRVSIFCLISGKMSSYHEEKSSSILHWLLVSSTGLKSTEYIFQELRLRTSFLPLSVFFCKKPENKTAMTFSSVLFTYIGNGCCSFFTFCLSFEANLDGSKSYTYYTPIKATVHKLAMRNIVNWSTTFFQLKAIPKTEDKRRSDIRTESGTFFQMSYHCHHAGPSSKHDMIMMSECGWRRFLYC